MNDFLVFLIRALFTIGGLVYLISLILKKTFRGN